MSLRPDGTYRCDCCDVDVGNASVVMAAKVVDVDDAGNQRNLDFCREVRKGFPRGCTGRLLSPSMTTAYTAAQEARS